MDVEVTKKRLALLVGAENREPEAFDQVFLSVASELSSLDGLDAEQLNRLLVAAGFNRVSQEWFDYFEKLGSTFDERLSQWRQRAMLRFANFRWAFRKVSQLTSDHAIEDEMAIPRRNLDGRRAPLTSLRTIDRRDTPMLGYVAGGKVEFLRSEQERGETLEAADADLVKRFERAWADGLHNLYEYCVAEHMDVYVATSMRDSEDFYSVSRFVDQLFRSPGSGFELVSYFDPTQSTHDDRIAKGIVEGLMLKRAFATIYLAQEKDTLGKDSEFATTLVQGKPVIAYVPEVRDRDEFKSQLVDDLKQAASDDPVGRKDDHPEYRRLMDRLLTLPPKWWNETQWPETGIESESQFETALDDYVAALATHYDDRARLLKDGHPLGVQVALSTGVPNGALVARNVEECRQMLSALLTGNLHFKITARRTPKDEVDDFDGAVMDERLLREATTDSIFRVAMGETPVANAFWNTYFE